MVFSKSTERYVSSKKSIRSKIHSISFRRSNFPDISLAVLKYSSNIMRSRNRVRVGRLQINALNFQMIDNWETSSV